MDPQRWKQVEDLLQSALRLPADQREGFVRRQCTGDSALQQEVISLLISNQEAGTFLRRPAIEVAARAAAQATSSKPGSLSFPLEGQILSHYKVLSKLGGGGMGVVYEAEDLRLGRRVALKLLPENLAQDRKALERFEREARAASSLNHPGICTIYEVEEYAQQPVIVMELLEGESLKDKIRTGPLPLNDILEFGIQASDALRAAHEKNIIHRDIKPANIFIVRPGRVKILDFGLAKVISTRIQEEDPDAESLTAEGVIPGTTAYMSPEQVRGEELDARSDLFSLGVVLYEIATGKRPFSGKNRIVLMDAILNAKPILPSRSNTALPAEFDAVILRALGKKPDARYQDASELCTDLQHLKRATDPGRSGAAIRKSTASPLHSLSPIPVSSAGFWLPRVTRHKVLALAFFAALFVTAALAMYLHLRPARTTPTRDTQWEQLTFFTDAAVYPALSPDGRLLAFIRGSDAFLTPGDLYVKMLPSGEPVQLTHDKLVKLSPEFSPDGTQIAYGTEDPWDTWEVPVLGGEPHLFLRNASSLTWIEGGKRLLFSEIQGGGLHMGVATSDEARGQSRGVYMPIGSRSMVHHSYLSPDGKWVLIASQMDEMGNLGQCGVVPFDGSGREQLIGPAGARCSTGAWSPDGTWIYLSSNQGGRFHIWEQRFPGGEPQQVTSGPTEEEGIAMARDGRSFLTSVGTKYLTVWTHDARTEHQMSSEGDAFSTKLSKDGRKLFYLKKAGPRDAAELWSTDLTNGSSDRILPGYGIDETLPGYYASYALAGDGNRLAFVKRDEKGISHIWLASTDHRTSPQQLASVENEDEPMFLPNGNLVYRASESGKNYVYTRQQDGSGRKKLVEDAILDLDAVSPDGRWIVVLQNDETDKDHPYRSLVYPLQGGKSVTLCALCYPQWSLDGKYLVVQFLPPPHSLETFFLPLSGERGLPRLPAEGLGGPEALRKSNRVIVLPRGIDAALGPEKYSYTATNIRRNIYRIPIP